MVRGNPGLPESTMLGFGDRVSAPLAALANGALAHALNFDALGGAGGHAGVAAVVAPLAMAERRGAVNGREFLASIAVAAELNARLAGALSAAGVDANQKFLEGQLLGYMPAALGAGRVLGFTPSRMHNVLGLALMQTAGTRQVSFEGGAAKAIYGGYANHGAILSVLLADEGIEARCAAIDGPAGIFGLFYEGRYEASVMRDGLGQTYHLLDTYFKPWATSGTLHPFIEACMELRRQNRFDAAEIAHIQLRAAPHAKAWLEPVKERRYPKNAATAANSIFFGVAKTLVNGTMTLADFTPEGLVQPAVLKLADVVNYALDEQMGDAIEVEVTLRDGRVLQSRQSGEHRRLGWEQLVEKFRDCAQYAAVPVTSGALEEAIGRIANLEKEEDMGVLPALLSGRVGRGS